MGEKRKKLRDYATSVKDAMLFDLDVLRVKEGWNERHDCPELVGYIRGIADAIKAHGIECLPPITVYMEEGTIFLSDGHCRLHGARIAREEGAEVKGLYGWSENRNANDAERVLKMLLRNTPGRAHTPMEQAGIVHRLLAFGWSEPEIAQRAGFSLSHAYDLIKLLGAPESVKQMVSRGEVSATTAIATIKERKAAAPQVLRDAVEKAKGEGKNKATPRHIPKISEEQQTKVLQSCPNCGHCF